MAELQIAMTAIETLTAEIAPINEEDEAEPVAAE